MLCPPPPFWAYNQATSGLHTPQDCRWEYDGSGECTKMPSTAHCSGINVAALPCTERDGATSLAVISELHPVHAALYASVGVFNAVEGNLSRDLAGL